MKLDPDLEGRSAFYCSFYTSFLCAEQGVLDQGGTSDVELYCSVNIHNRHTVSLYFLLLSTVGA
jgi:hypothetical protein